MASNYFAYSVLLLFVVATIIDATPIGREDNALTISSPRALARQRVKRCGSCCCMKCCCCCGCGKRKKKRSLETLRIKHMVALLERGNH
ncbi:hypothetical protein AB6A40_001812 [Gnathostoma spinigerum]|uniref:Hepcidin n=1 Tax=Gnathostoma spinigerum TaxID=75299 RepID=A0ABD6EE32_9BILA